MTEGKNKQVKKKSEARKKAEKLMSQYHMIDAIIESKRIDVESYKLTQNFDVSEAQRTNAFHSEAERLGIIAAELTQYENTKKQLTSVFNALKPVQRVIWQRRYLDEEKDSNIIDEVSVSYYCHEKKYYRMKKEMIEAVIKALSLNV